MAALDLGTLGIKITADGSAALSEIERTGSELKRAATEASGGWDSAFKAMDSAADAAEASIDELSGTADKALDEVSRSAEDAGQALDGTGEAAQVAGDAAQDAGKRASDAAEQAADGAETMRQKWEESGQVLTDIGSKLSMAITVPLTAAMTAAVKLSSDLNETVSKTEVVFDNMSDAVLDWSNTSVESMGLAQQTALDMTATYGDLGTSMGMSRQQAADMSMSLVQLAADMASFKNISIERANAALTAIYTGEAESLKAMGIVMTEANLEQYALNEGIKTQYKNMTQTEKVMLRYRYVMAQTANAQGDFARTGDSLANQSRKLSENVKELGAKFGSILAPSVTGAIAAMNNAVSWLNGLDEKTKRVILTTAEVAAAIPVVVAAVGTIISVVAKLQTALAGLIANPAALWIAGIATACAAAAIIIGNVKASIDEYNAAVAEMQDKHTSVTTSYEALIIATQDPNDSVDDVLGDIESAIGTAQEAGEFTAYVASKEDSMRDTKSVMDAIEAALKSREMYLSISGKKKEDDPVWNELNNLKSGIEAGTVTIYGKDGDGTLAKLDGLIATTNSDLSALKAYEENAVKPLVEVDSEAAKKNLNELLQKCADLQGYENAKIAFEANVEETVNQLGLGQKSLQAFINTNANWAEGVDSLIKDFTDMGEAAKEALGQKAMTAMVDYVNMGLELGYTTEQLETGIGSIRDAYTKLATETDVSTQKQKELSEALRDGSEANDNSTILSMIVSMITRTTTTKTETDATKAQAEAQTNLNGLQEANLATQEYTNTNLEYQAENLGTVADKMEGDVTNAYAKYESAIDSANEAEAEGVAAVDDMITKKTELQDALATYSSFVSDSGGDTQAAMTALKEFSIEEYNAVVDYYGGLDAAIAEPISSIEQTAYTMQFEISELEKTAESDRQAVRDKAAEDRKQAEEQLGTDIAAITSGFDMEALQALHQQCTDVGNIEGASKVERVMGLEGYCRTAEGMVSDNNFNMLSLNRQYLGEVEGLESSAYNSGNSVGKSIGEGMYDGMDSWGKKLADKAAQMMRETIGAYRKEGNINSPSRKTRDLVGKPLMQGIEVGMNDYLPEVLGSVKASVDKIISAGTPVNAYKNTSNAVTNIGKQGGTTTINQTNNFTSRTLTPYEQQREIRRLNKGLAEAFG